MTRLNKFFALSADEQGLLLRTLALVGAVRLSLWLLPFARVLSLTKRLSKTTMGDATFTPTELAAAVARASTLVPKASCLTQALSLKVWLERNAYPSELRIGVGRDAVGTFEAHAWVEQNGAILIGDRPDLARYTPLPSLEQFAAVQGRN